MNAPSPFSFSSQTRGSAAFELLAVVSLSGLISTALIPLLGSSAEIDRLERDLLRSKLDSYLLELDAMSSGWNVDQLPKQLISES